MKNLILSIFIVIIIGGLAACNNNPNSDTSNRDIQLLSDSTLYPTNAFSDTAITVKTEAIPVKVAEKPQVVTRTRKNIAARSTVSAPVYTKPASVSPVVTAPPVVTPPIVAPSENTTVGNNAQTGSDSSRGTVATIPQEQKKKGWSKAAQGAAIGGVTGAVGGAILSKKKGLGAVVGGIVGAAGGYIIGKNMDKKDNRFNME